MKQDLLILLGAAVANSPTGAVPDANDAASSSSGETAFTLTRRLESLSTAAAAAAVPSRATTAYGELRANMNRYPGYTGDVNTTGSVYLTFPTEGLSYVTELSYDLQGLEPECTRCGIHVHIGTSCDPPGDVWGHYHRVAVNPWTRENGAVYDSDESGAALGLFRLRTGYDTPADTAGHAVVIHGRDGTRLSCGILGAAGGAPGAGDAPAPGAAADASPPSDGAGGAPGEPPRADDDAYDRIMALRNQTFPHQCFVAVIDRAPFVWCDIRVPASLNVTAEIRDGTCDEFDTPARSEFVTEGMAQPILVPVVTEEEKLMGTFDHSYCAGTDVFYNEVDGDTGVGRWVSLLSGRFAMEITYSYDQRIDEETGVIVEDLSSVRLSDANTEAEAENRDLEIGLGVLAGAVITLALVAIVYKKKKKAKAGSGQEVNPNVELAPMVDMNDGDEVVYNENEII